MQTPGRNNCDSQELQGNGRLLQRILLDVLIFIVLLITAALCELYIEPYRRGFFCDDETIRYPYKANTISNLNLVLLVILSPIVVIIIGEYARQYKTGQLNETRQIFYWRLLTWKLKAFKQCVYFLFGLLLTIDATELGKFTIGRLRPHFMAVCQPQLADGTTCYDAVNRHRYVENYFCLGSGFNLLDIRESRLSFPSGHSSLSFYAFIYISLYLQKRMYWHRSQLARHFIQFSFIMVAWFTALSRIMDNWHHWSDVLCGCFMGCVAAVITAKYISQFFKTAYPDFRDLRLLGLSRQNTSATLNEVLAYTPPPYIINTQLPHNTFTTTTFSTKL